MFRRKEILKKKYSHSVLTKMAIQFGFSDINDDKFVDFIIPPGTTPRGFGDDIGYDDIDPDSGFIIDNQSQKPNPMNSFGDDLGFDGFNPDGGGSSNNKRFIDEVESAQYRELARLNNSERALEHPEVTIVEPSDEERSTGFMYRYFLQQANSPTSPIIEVDKDQYESWKKLGGGIDSSFYNGISLKWRVRGELETKIGQDGIVRKGVLDGNTDSITLASETLPALKNQMQNLVKYWKR